MSSVAHVRHRFVSSKPSSVDATKIGSVEYNDTHKFSGGIHGSLLMRDTTDVDLGASWLESAAVGKILVSQGSGSAPAWSSTPSLTSLALSTPLAPVSGGTGLNSYTPGDIIFASSPTALARRAAVADGNVLRSAGSGVAPIWGKVRLSGAVTDITGVLDLDKGGTGAINFPVYGVLYGKGGSPLEATAAGPDYGVFTSMSGTAPVFTADPVANSFGARSYLGLVAMSGGALKIQHQSLRLNAVSGAAILTAGGIIPAGSLVVGVTTRVASVFGATAGLTTISIGDGSDVDRWGGNKPISQTSVTDMRHFTDTTPKVQTALTSVVITADVGTFDGSGSILVTAYFVRLTAASSD